jgi:4-alpha-glucanotransferase
VIVLRKQFALPGMKVLQFAWGSGPENPFLPHNHAPDFVVYTGTHDNNTTLGWYRQECTEQMEQHIADYTGCPVEDINETLRRIAYSSPAALAVLPMQDLLGLGEEARMNTPGEAVGNWSWRLAPDQLGEELAARLRQEAQLYGRGNQ